MLYHCVKFDLIHFSSFWVIVDTHFVRDKYLTFNWDLDLGCGNLNFVRHTSHFALSFYEVWLNSLNRFLSYGWQRFVSHKPLTFDCDVDFGRRNLNFVRDTPSHFSLSFYEVWLIFNRFMNYGWHTICMWQTFDLQLWPWPWSWELLCVTHLLILLFLLSYGWHTICNGWTDGANF